MQKDIVARGLGLQSPQAKHSFCVYQVSCFLQSLSCDFMGHPQVLYALYFNSMYGTLIVPINIKIASLDIER